MMKFSTTLLSVQDMERSLAFYKIVFDQDVVCDLGRNKTLTCGLTLQLDFAKLVGFSEDKIKYKPYNMELYFETEDMDAFEKLINENPEIEKLHDAKTYPWHQRVVRIFDPDGNIIEVGESMESVAYREFDKGLSVEETAKETEHPTEIVARWYENYKKR